MHCQCHFGKVTLMFNCNSGLHVNAQKRKWVTPTPTAMRLLLYMSCNLLILTAIIRDCAIDPNTQVTLVNGRCCKLRIVLSPLRCKWNMRRIAAAASGWFTLRTKFTFKGMSLTNQLCIVWQASECVTTLPLTVFAQRNFAADFLQKKSTFKRKTVTLRYWARGLTGNVCCSS